MALLCALAGPALAAPDSELPNLNVFLDRSIEQPLPAPVRGRIAHVEERLGVPTFFWADRGHVGRDSLRALGLTPEQAARRHLFEHAKMYRQDPASLAEAPVERVHDIGRGAVIVSFRKEVDGVRVFRDELKVIMDPQLELIALSGYLPPHTRVALRGEDRPFNLGHATALVTALFDLTGVALEPNAVKLSGPVIEAYHPFLLAEDAAAQSGLRFGQPARVRKVLFTLPEGLEPGYYVELEVGTNEDRDARMYAYVVSAVDGRLLFRKNLTVHDAFTYRVWADANGLPWDGPQGTAWSPHPAGAPNGLQPQPVAQGSVTLEHGPISTNDPWLAAAATLSQGNNVDAYADLASPDGFGTGDERAQLSSALAFEYAWDPTVGPNATSSQIQAAITQLFFNNNFFHDWFYDAGFDEASGNAQTENFGRGGLGGDSLRVEAQDFSGENNANMSVPADGARPRMQMYIFKAQASQSVTLTRADGQSQAFYNNEATFGPTTFDVNAPYVLVDDGTGTTSDACEPIVNTAEVAGKIALIDRGTCTFVSKVQNAEAAGAVGVLIANNQSGGPPVLYGNAPGIAIPAMSVTRNGGNTLKSNVGAGGTVRMFRDTSNDRDGTLDNAIVAHEWGHYISNRLIGNATGLDNLQGVGMGEGWGDFHALLMVVREEDTQVPSNANWEGAYALSTWVTTGSGGDGLYYGIRRLPYSTDFSRNALTFQHIEDGVPLPQGVPTAFGANGQNNSEVHNAGEVWGTMLWECYAALLRDSTRLTFAEAQQRMREYLVASYKATPNSPTFLEARDALLAAAYAGDPEDFLLFSDAFARRGAGQKAVAPSRSSQNNSPVVEDFTSGSHLTLVSATLDDAVVSCDQDGVLDNGETGRLTVTIRNAGASALSGTVAQVTTQTPGITLANDGKISFPTSQPFGTVTGSLEVQMGVIQEIVDLRFELTFSDPSFAPDHMPPPEALSFRANAQEQVGASTLDDVEAETTPWRSGHNALLDGNRLWRRERLSPTQHVWFAPNPDAPADVFLISPLMQVTTDQDLVLTFKHRHDFEFDADALYDGGVLEIQVGNESWTDIGGDAVPGYTGVLEADRSSNPLAGRSAFTGRSPSYPGWDEVTVNLGSAYAGQAVRFRFRVGADDAAAHVGWQLDDIEVKGVEGMPFNRVVPQMSVCGNTTPVALAPAQVVVTEGETATLEGSGIDDDGDPLTYRWTQLEGPTFALPALDTPALTFTAPQVDGDQTLLFGFTVSDGLEVSETAQVQVLVRDLDAPPVARIRAPDQARPGDRVVLDGTGSTDPEGKPMTWSWTQTGGPTVTLEGGEGAAPAFVMPEGGEEPVTFTLIVNDGRHDSAPATVSISEAGAASCGCSTGSGAGFLPVWIVLALALFGLRRPRRSA